MIQISTKDDVNKVSDPVIAVGIQEEFERLSDDFLYPAYGYFIVIEKIEELTDPLELNTIITQHTARSLVDSLELIEEYKGYCQVLLILHADFGLSLFVSEKIMSLTQLKKLFEV